MRNAEGGSSNKEILLPDSALRPPSLKARLSPGLSFAEFERHQADS